MTTALRRAVGVVLLVLISGSCVRRVEGPLQPGAGLLTATTANSAGGNRYVTGLGALTSRFPLTIELSGQARWLVVAPLGDSTVWVVATEDGRLEAFEVGAEVKVRDLNLGRLAPGTPPALLVGAGGVLALAPPAASGSQLTHPVVLAAGGLAFVNEAGDVVVAGPNGNRKLEAEALPDARLALGSAGHLAVLGEPSSALDHAVLGDGLEAAVLLVYDLTTLEKVASVRFTTGEVFEAVWPLWADLDGDGIEELVLTLSTAQEGARLVAISETGRVVAQSQPIGARSRWRHLIAVAPFGPEGEIEIVDVRTPHIGGVVEFFQLRGDKLEIVAQIGEFSSHRLGSRNLDMAVAADVDGDGRVELVVPTVDMASLAIIGRTNEGAAVEHVFPLGGILTTNLGAVDVAGGLWFGAGVGTQLLVWPPS